MEAVDLARELNRRGDIWRGRRAAPGTLCGIPSGFADLDALLTAGGWPLGALTEVLSDHPSLTLSLALPALIRLSREPRWLLLVNPPYQPFAPALAARGLDLRRLVIVQAADDGPWACEQGLRSGACGAVLAWADRLSSKASRRLQLAAEQGKALALLTRPSSEERQPSPAALRLRTEPHPDGIAATLLKQRGALAGGTLVLDTPEESSRKRARGRRRGWTNGPDAARGRRG